MSSTATAELVLQARGGSAAALDALYARAARKLLPLIRIRLGAGLRDRLESRDILQAALLRSFEKLDSFHNERSASFMAWLARIAENEIRDQADFHGRERRDVGQEAPLEAAAAVPQPVRSALSQALLAEQNERLERALETLSAEQREVILLRKLEELSFAEVGERMARSADAARMLFARAMAALTLKLGA